VNGTRADGGLPHLTDIISICVHFYYVFATPGNIVVTLAFFVSAVVSSVCFDFISTKHSSMNKKFKKDREFFCSVANLLDENLVVLRVNCRIS
jgi:hypothetical protein